MSQYKLIDNTLCTNLNDTAQNASRKRSHHNLHDDLQDPVQRLCIGLQSGTYIRPHRHPEKYKWELMLAIQGRVRMVLFDNDGRLMEKIDLSEQGPVKGIEIPPNTWHTLLPLDEQAVIMEIKQGPYLPIDPENFATWSPPETASDVNAFLNWCRDGEIGSYYQPG